MITPTDWLGSFPKAISDLATRRTRCFRNLLGQPLRMADGRRYVPFRHTRKATAEWSNRSEPAVLQPRFHLRCMGPRRRVLHALFRVVCIITTPFFVGLPGFRSKLWMVDKATGDFAGLYEWDDGPTAQAYAEGLCKVLNALSEPGSVGYELTTGVTVDDYLGSTTHRKAA